MSIPVEINFTGSGTLTSYLVMHCVQIIPPSSLSEPDWNVVAAKKETLIRPGETNLEKGSGVGSIETKGSPNSDYWLISVKFAELGDNFYATLSNGNYIASNVSSNCSKVVININGDPKAPVGAGFVTVDGGDKVGGGALASQEIESTLDEIQEKLLEAAVAGGA